jgi:hypothetical protein
MSIKWFSQHQPVEEVKSDKILFALMLAQQSSTQLSIIRPHLP